MKMRTIYTNYPPKLCKYVPKTFSVLQVLCTLPYPTPLHCLLHCKLLYYAMLQYCTFHSQLLYSAPRYAMMLQTTSTLFFSAPLLYATVLYSLLCSAVLCCVLLCSTVLCCALQTTVLCRVLCCAALCSTPRHNTSSQKVF